ncbi:MAG: prevent-host-death protein [Verrucomicrobiota bacterium]|nr:prevent-host-death protein [Verrucomicrobiota bacterium]
MDILLSEFKSQCSRLIHRVETLGITVDIIRDGKIVARLSPVAPAAIKENDGTKPWTHLRGTGHYLAGPDESVITEKEFEVYQ